MSRSLRIRIVAGLSFLSLRRFYRRRTGSANIDQIPQMDASDPKSETEEKEKLSGDGFMASVSDSEPAVEAFVVGDGEDPKEAVRVTSGSAEVLEPAVGAALEPAGVDSTEIVSESEGEVSGEEVGASTVCTEASKESDEASPELVREDSEAAGCSSSGYPGDAHKASADPASHHPQEYLKYSVRTGTICPVEDKASSGLTASVAPGPFCATCKCRGGIKQTPEERQREDALAAKMDLLLFIQNEKIEVPDGYTLNTKIRQGNNAIVFDATRKRDGKQMVLKFYSKHKENYRDVVTKHMLVPKEVILYIQVHEGPRVPELLKPFGWENNKEHYVIIMDSSRGFQTLQDFLSKRRTVTENEARVIMSQVVYGVQVCCQRGVAHRDTNPNHILINPETLQCKLFCFSHGLRITNKAFTGFQVQKNYTPPELLKKRKYYAQPGAVWALGVLLFEILLMRNPTTDDLFRVKKMTRTREDLSEDCHKFIFSCLTKNPKKRIELEKLHHHHWFKLPTNPRTTPAQPQSRMARFLQRMRLPFRNPM